MRNKAKKILGTTKYADESWADTIDRVNRDVGVDIKTCYKLIGVIMDELDEHDKEKTTTKKG